MKKTVILFLLCILLTGCSFLGNNTDEKAKKESVVAENEFVGDKGWKESYIEKLDSYKCESDNDGFTCIYHLVDIDDNGIPELIVKTGEDDEDMKYDIFTYTNKLVNLGQRSATHVNLFDENKYVIYQVSSMGLESIYHMSIKDNATIGLELVEQNDYSNNLDNPYKDFGGALISYSIKDTKVIDNYK